MTKFIEKEKLTKEITSLTSELRVREVAAKHLKEIPARHNQTRINQIYDSLNHKHIELIEKTESQRNTN